MPDAAPTATPDIEDDIRAIEKGRLSEEQTRQKLLYWRGRCSTRDFKRLERAARRTRPLPEVFLPGPTVSDAEITMIAKRIESALRPFVNAGSIKPGERITFFISGSLVAGLSSNPASPFYGKPSDWQRVSDVDLLVVVPIERFIIIPDSMKASRPMPRTLAIGVEKAAYAGPIGVLCETLSSLKIAGRVHREVNMVLVPEGVESNPERYPTRLVTVFDA